jgi:hypothetical protein
MKSANTPPRINSYIQLRNVDLAFRIDPLTIGSHALPPNGTDYVARGALQRGKPVRREPLRLAAVFSFMAVI